MHPSRTHISWKCFSLVTFFLWYNPQASTSSTTSPVRRTSAWPRSPCSAPSAACPSTSRWTWGRPTPWSCPRTWWAEETASPWLRMGYWSTTQVGRGGDLITVCEVISANEMLGFSVQRREQLISLVSWHSSGKHPLSSYRPVFLIIMTPYSWQTTSKHTPIHCSIGLPPLLSLPVALDSLML